MRSDPRFEDPFNTDPVSTAEIEDRAAAMDEKMDPAFYSQDLHSMADSQDPFAENVSLREAQMWSNFSQPPTPEEEAALENFGPDAKDFAFIDDAADTDYILSLSTRGEHAMDRHLEDAVYGEGDQKMQAQAHIGATFVGARNHSRAPSKGPLDKSRSLKKIVKIYKHLAQKSALNHGRKSPDASDKQAAKAVLTDYAARLSGMGSGLPTEILGGDYGSPIFNDSAANSSTLGAASPKRAAAVKARREAQLKAAAARAEARKVRSAKQRQEQLARLKARREAAQKRQQAALLRAEAAKKRRAARSKARPGTPTSSPMTVQPGRPGQAPSVTISPIAAPQTSPLSLRVTPESPPQPSEDQDSQDQSQDQQEPQEQAPDMPATEQESATADADADVTEAHAEASEADADAQETESSEEEVTPDELSGDFIEAAPPEQTKVLKKAAEKTPTGAKIRAGMTVYRKAKAQDPRAKAALAKMAVKAEKGDPQAKTDLLSVKLGKIAQNQLVKAKRAFATLKKAAARRKGFDLATLLKTSSAKARDRYHNSLAIQRKASQGDAQAIQAINTINKAAQTGDQAGVRAQKNLALASLALAHTQNPAARAQFDSDFALVRQARGAIFNADARRQLATVAAAAKAGDKPSQARLVHFTIAALILDMMTGRDYKVTPALIAKAGGKLPAVPASVKQAAATLASARKGNPLAKQKLQATAKSALSGDLHAIKMMGDVALVGAMLAAKNGKAIHPNLKEASKIVDKAKQGDPKAKRTIARATIAAKKGDPKGVKAMVALTAANTARKAGGIPVEVTSRPDGSKDLLPLSSLPSPLRSAAGALGRFFSFYKDGVSSRAR